MIGAIHHVQLAMPKGQEQAARTYYGTLLGMSVAPKPSSLAQRGGIWFYSGLTQLHLGVEEPFKSARKAHPGLLCTNLEKIADRLRSAQYPVIWDDSLAQYRRFYSHDPFENRLEFLSPLTPQL
jgi:hypothetical protein